MFTGIVEEMGKIKSIARGSRSAVLTIEASKVLEGSQTGDSIAVNGVCLTVTSLGSGEFTADVMGETLRRSSLGSLQRGSRVNLERAMAADGRFGGHIVSGHIDGTGRVANMKKEENAVWVTVDTPAQLLKYIVEKGSIAIDGISLTVSQVSEKSFSVSLIPHTGAQTTLLQRKPGDVVNLENDVIGKYVERIMNFGESSSGDNASLGGNHMGTGEKSDDSSHGSQSRISMEFLAEHGF